MADVVAGMRIRRRRSRVVRLRSVLRQVSPGWRDRRCDSARVPRPVLWKRSSMVTVVMTPWGAVSADLVADLADDLADVHKEQAFVARSGVVRDVRGQEIDGPVGEDAAAQAAGAPASA
ncbi:hypothetical protein ACFC5X_29135 [Streptomyces sp. NPDC055952]|uniref:hypothetical protein n=1 Tax=Streptomyces sp. NPDC055952 TaxID=3345663 RepID=UPI0035DA0A3D